MIITEGEHLESEVNFVPESSMLKVHARLMTVASYHLPDDMLSMQLLEKKYYHSLEQWLIMLVASLTVIGLLVSIPLYIWGKQIRFRARFMPKHGKPFEVAGGKLDWKYMQPFLQ